MGSVGKDLSRIGSEVGKAFNNLTPAGLIASGQLENRLFGGKPEINQDVFRPTSQEDAFAEMLRREAEGPVAQGPSVAEVLATRMNEQAMNQAMAQAASARGINPSMAARFGAQAQSDLASNAIGQMAALRQQEQEAALNRRAQSRAMYADMLLSQRQGRQAGQAAQMAAEEAWRQRRSNMIGGIGQAAGTAAGAYFGGPAGAQMGGQVGAGLGTRMTGEPSAMNQRGPQSGMMYAADGGMVPGRAKTRGDHENNDVVPAMLSPGEMIVPRTVVQKGPKAVMSFAEKILAQGGAK